jgi:Bacterial Ig domain/Metallo-peptidase family M12/Secretion system C-terminal sorting domain
MAMFQKPIVLFMVCALSVIYHSATAQKTLSLQAKSTNKTVNTPVLAKMTHYDLFELNAKALHKQAKQATKNGFELNLQFGTQHDWAIVLEPSKVHGDDFKFITSNGETIEVEKNITYKGYLKNDPKTKVRMTIGQNYVFGLILDKDQHSFEMVNKSAQLSEADVFVVYDKTSSVGNSVCGHDSPVTLPDSPTPSNLTQNELMVNTYCPKLGIVLDKQGLAKAGSVANFNSDLQTMINIANGYNTTFSSQYELNPVYVITAASNPWTDAPGNQSALVTNFATWAVPNLTPNNYNCALLYTGTNMNGIGYAFIGHMCPSDNSRYGEIDYQYAQPTTHRANLTTHELGHLWGAQHTSQSSTMIMSPSIWDGTLNWDATAVSVITNNINTTFNTCLPRCSKLAVNWTYPVNNQVFPNKNALTFAATAAADGTVTKVEFFVNNVSIGSDNTSPYTMNWTPPAFANYTLKATTTDNLNNTISQEITITVQNGTSVTVTSNVNSSSDDAEQEVNTGVMSLSSTDLELINEAGTLPQEVGMRFNNINVPRNATITNAYIQFTADETDATTVTLSIYGEDKGNAPTFTNTAYNMSSRVKTTGPVSWSPPAWSTLEEAGTAQRTPNISSIIQTIVNRVDWNPNNSLAIIITGANTTKRTAHAYDYFSTGVGSPILTITYTIDGTIPVEWLSINALWTKDNAIKVEWKVAHEDPYTQYEVQRSSDGQNFKTIQTLQGKHQDTYSYLDTEAANLSNILYYRIKNEAIGEKMQYSSIVSVKSKNKDLGLTMAPNPFVGSVHVVLDVPQTATVQAKIFNAIGQQMATLVSETLSAGQHTIKWDVPVTIPSGVYYLEVSDGQQRIVRKLVKTP